MKALLMFDDHDFTVDPVLLDAIDHPYRRNDERPQRTERVGEQDMIDDLELEQLWNAMARGDAVVYASVRTAILSGLDSVEQVRYRQRVLTDCLAQPSTVRELYQLSVRAITEERKIWRGMFGGHAEALLHRSVGVLEMLVPILQRLRTITTERTSDFSSPGFTRFFDTLNRELDEDYFDEIGQHLRQLRFPRGVLMSAQLGTHNQGVDYVLRSARPENQGRFRFRRAALAKPTYSHTVPPRDDAGAQALGRLRDRGLTLVANALGQSTDHILAFFAALRSELGFYVGCLNLHDQLTAKGELTCLPDPHPTGTMVRSGQALYDPCLSLRLSHRMQPNDLHGDDKPMIIITGANQDGKSTFLRSLAVAQLMMQAGTFTAAQSYAASIVTTVFTHYRREEDATMTSGKFDEELARMSHITTAIGPGALLICNESFAATNEREGSEVAYEFTRAMNTIGVAVIYVTHLYDLADRYLKHHHDTTLFLRAERDDGGRRPFRLTESEPLPTSYGQDLYLRTFTDDTPANTDSSVTTRQDSPPRTQRQPATPTHEHEGSAPRPPPDRDDRRTV